MNSTLLAKQKRIKELEAENKRLRETIREALNSNDFAARMAKEPPATDSYGINARRLWSMKEALEVENVSGYVLNSRMLSIIKAVAHIGVDFGYGEYELEQEHIAMARAILKESNDEEH